MNLDKPRLLAVALSSKMNFRNSWNFGKRNSLENPLRFAGIRQRAPAVKKKKKNSWKKSKLGLLNSWSFSGAVIGRETRNQCVLWKWSQSFRSMSFHSISEKKSGHRFRLYTLQCGRCECSSCSGAYEKDTGALALLLDYHVVITLSWRKIHTCFTVYSFFDLTSVVGEFEQSLGGVGVQHIWLVFLIAICSLFSPVFLTVLSTKSHLTHREVETRLFKTKSQRGWQSRDRRFFILNRRSTNYTSLAKCWFMSYTMEI